VWDIPNKRIRNIFKGHKSAIAMVDFSPDGRLVASATWDGTVRIFHMRSGFVKVCSGDGESFFSVRSCSPGKHIATTTSNGILDIWDIGTGRLIRRRIGYNGDFYTMAFTPDGNGLLSGSHNGILKLWDICSIGISSPTEEPFEEREVKEYEGHKVCLFNLCSLEVADYVLLPRMPSIA
jgi:glucose repression regulatory protein TUP1